MTVRFVEEAQIEFLEAISYYEEARPGLGRRFKDEVDRSFGGFQIILSYTTFAMEHFGA